MQKGYGFWAAEINGIPLHELMDRMKLALVVCELLKVIPDHPCAIKGKDIV